MFGRAPLVKTLRSGLQTERKTWTTETLLLHYYMGERGEGTDRLDSGAVRLSAIQPRKKSFLANLDKTFAEANDYELPSETLFARHLSVFGRDYTLLIWAILYCGKRGQQASNGHAINFNAAEGSVFAAENQATAYGTLVLYSLDLLSALCPPHLVRAYSTELSKLKAGQYTDRLDVYRDLFVACRGAALRMILRDKEATRSLDLLADCFKTVPDTSLDESELRLKFLGALQSALVFCHWAQNSFEPSMSMYLYKGKADREGSPPWMILSVLPEGELVGTTDLVFERLRGHHGEVLSKIKEISVPSPKDLEPQKDIWKFVDKNYGFIESPTVSGLIERHFPSPVFKKWRTSILTWLVSLAHSLRGALHEGNRLGFWFVAADLSEIQDSRLFRLRPILETDLLPVCLPWAKDSEECPWKVDYDNDNWPDGQIERAKRALEGEHYAWFQEGHYALFWDASFPRRAPAGLLEVRNSSWARWENTIERRRLLAQQGAVGGRIPSIIIVYVRPDGESGAFVGADRLLICRRNRKQWEQWNQESRREVLKSYFPGNSEEREKLARICVRIADDAHRGCCLVVLNDKVEPRFLSMGSVWKSGSDVSLRNEDEEDLGELMAMDGATCIYKPSNESEIRLAFRCLLTPDDLEDGILDEFRKIAETADFRLRGTGSRRWSAAVTALLDKVRCILVVSQDGDIHMWNRERRPHEVELKLTELPAGSTTTRLHRWILKPKKKRTRKKKQGHK